MRVAHLFLLPGLAVGPALAAGPAAPAAPREHADQRIERIHTEDAGSRIDELRVGGQTQRITVQPKAAVPAYEVQPADGVHSTGPARESAPGATGPRVWNVLKF